MNCNKRIVWFGIISIVAVLYILDYLLLPLIIGFFIMMLLSPVLYWLQKKGIKKGRAILLIYMGLIVLIIGITTGFIASLPTFDTQMYEVVQVIDKQLVHLQDGLSSTFNLQLDAQENWLKEEITTIIASSTHETGGILSKFFDVLSGFILSVVYSIFLFIYQERFLAIISETYDINSSRLQTYVSNIQVTFSKFMVGTLIIILILAITYAIVLASIGLPYFPLIAILAALAAFVPTIGTALGIVFATLVTLFMVSPFSALLVLGIFSLIQVLEEYLILPHVMGKKIDLNMFIIIFTIVAMGMLWGILGIFLAVPLLGVVKSILDHHRNDNKMLHFINDMLKK